MSWDGPPPIEPKPLTNWECRYCHGTMNNVWLARYMSDTELDAALWLHEDQCPKREDENDA